MPNHGISIKDLFAGSVQLASPPELFARLSEIIDAPEATLTDAADVIERDPSISARLIKIANSAFYGLPAKLVSVRQAISLIGYQETRDLVLATLVVDRFPPIPEDLMSMRQFWSLSVRIALIAKLMTARHPEGRRLGASFICGLLHEVGRLVIYQRIPEPARDALLLVKTEHVTELEAERRVMGFDHYQVGGELARRWRLPEVIQLTIETHEQPALAGIYREEAQLVALSRHLSCIEARGNDEAITEQLEPEALSLWKEQAPHAGPLSEILAAADAQFNALFAQIYRRKS
jgi:HD-like signal output (HDOD) protein